MDERLFDKAVNGLECDGEELTARTIALIYQQLTSYARVPYTNLHTSYWRNLIGALRSLREHRELTTDDLSEADMTVRERANQGVPVEDMMTAYRINIRVIEQRFIELARETGVAADLLLEGVRLLWATADVVTAQLAVVYQELGIANALQDAQRRTAWVRSLMAGALSNEDLASQCPLFGLNPEIRYCALRARGAATNGTEDTRRRLERASASHDGPAMIVIVGSDYVGVVPQQPSKVSDVTVALGPAVILRDAAGSFRVASKVVESAWRLGRRGVVRLEDVSWRVALFDHPEVSEYLWHRYLAPLAEQGEFGDLIKVSVRTYLANKMSIPAAAAELVVHVNTMRYRLNKFAEFTGANLSAADVVELAWALEFDQHRSIAS